MTDRTWQHPWLRIQRLIRSILEVRRDPTARPVMKATRMEALRAIGPEHIVVDLTRGAVRPASNP